MFEILKVLVADQLGAKFHVRLPLFDLFKVPESFEAKLLFSDLRLLLVPGGGFPRSAKVSPFVFARARCAWLEEPLRD